MRTYRSPQAQKHALPHYIETQNIHNHNHVSIKKRGEGNDDMIQACLNMKQYQTERFSIYVYVIGFLSQSIRYYLISFSRIVFRSDLFHAKLIGINTCTVFKIESQIQMN